MNDYFDDCVARGGKMATETLSETEYRVVCSIDDNTYYGETQTKLTTKQKRRNSLAKRVKDGNKKGSLKST